MHGYFTRTLGKDLRIDHSSSKSWTKNEKLGSHFERCISAIQEQEIPIKVSMNKRAKDAGKEPPCDNKCRLCKANVADVTHLINSCPFISADYYISMRTDMVAKTLFKEISKKESPRN